MLGHVLPGKHLLTSIVAVDAGHLLVDTDLLLMVLLFALMKTYLAVERAGDDRAGGEGAGGGVAGVTVRVPVCGHVVTSSVTRMATGTGPDMRQVTHGDIRSGESYCITAL